MFRLVKQLSPVIVFVALALLLSIEESTAFSPTYLLFIGITSGGPLHLLRHAGRETWLRDCTEHAESSALLHKAGKLDLKTCDYRFFIDTIVDKYNSTDISETAKIMSLRNESQSYGDIVFRNDVPFMVSRHPLPRVHYGRHPPYEGEENYQLRRMYKVDWKVSFLKWVVAHNKTARYYLFVEDDSYTCLRNLLYQLSILVDISKHNTAAVPLLRAGTPMYSTGFDDSSTLMSGEIGEAFAIHYPETDFDCSEVWNCSLAVQAKSFDWLSWGNSFIYCHWKRVLESHLNLTYISPALYCIAGNHSGEVEFPCTTHPIIFHHRYAAEIFINEFTPMRYRARKSWADPFLEDPTFNESFVNASLLGGYKTNHICEYMVTIDKIKDPHHIRSMHQLSGNKTKPHFKNLSAVFLHQDDLGWKIILDEYETTHDSSHHHHR